MKKLSDGRSEVLLLGPEDYATLDEDDFGVPGLVATEVLGPFVRLQAVGPLIMVHDGVFEPRHGIGHHPHRHNERLFYILEGAVDHDDVLNGIQGHMATGDLGRLTEGRRGMLHQEWNNTDGRTRAYILVYRTDPIPPTASFELLRDEDAPRYEEASGVWTKELVGPKASFPVHGDVRLFTDTTLSPGSRLDVEVRPDEGLLLAPLQGDVSLFDGAVGDVTPGQTVIAGPHGGDRTMPVAARAEARVLRAVFGPGFGLVLR